MTPRKTRGKTHDCTLLVLLASLVIWPVPGVSAERQGQFPLGEPVEKVACQAAEGQSYALYLPTSYSPDRRFPVLFCFDPGYRGMLPLGLFREAAERHGFIIASSNNFRSDLPTLDESFETLIAIWNDVHSRFSTDPNRLYATGFSGGARISWILDFVTPKFPFAGIIGVGAGLPSDHKNYYLRKDLAFFGLAGEVDFNYYEMADLDTLLSEKGMPHRFESFQGAHEWPPAADCERALDWMQVQAMRRGVVTVDEEFQKTFFEESLTRARLAESRGHLVDAEREYSSILRDFEGSMGLEAAEEAWRSLTSSTAYTKEAKSFKKQKKKAMEYRERGLAMLERVRRAEKDALPEMRDLLFDMRISALQKKSRVEDPVESLAAQRVLESLFVQSVFYYPRESMDSGDFDRARLYRRLACEIKPESWRGWYQLAQTEAQMGLKQSSLDSLKKAVESGFEQVDWLERDQLLDPVRDNPEFLEILEGLKKD